LGYQIIKGGASGRDIGAFLVNLINLRNLQQLGLDRFVFFWDNAKIHKANILKPLLRYLHIFPNAAYSPQLNPIEQVFGLWKFHFRQFQVQNELDVVKCIIKSCQNITPNHICQFVKHSFECYIDCLEKNDLL